MNNLYQEYIINEIWRKFWILPSPKAKATNPNPCRRHLTKIYHLHITSSHPTLDNFRMGLTVTKTVYMYNM